LDKRWGAVDVGAKAVGVTIENLTGTGAVFGRTFQHAAEKLSSWDAALSAEVKAGNGTAAANQFDALTRAAREQGMTMEDIKSGFPQYTNALSAVGVATVGASKATVDASTAADQAAAATAKQKAAVADLTTALDASKNALLQLRGGEDGYWASVDAVTKALKDDGKTLDVHTEKGRANRAALDALASSSMGYLGTMQQQGVPAAKFNASLDDMRGKLFDAAVKMGMTKNAAHEYANKLLGIPHMVNTKVTATGLSSATAQLQAFINKLVWVDGRNIAPRVGAGTVLAPGHATGGLLPGAPSARDNMLIGAASGEFVVNSRATSKNLGLLRAINAGYATGGVVGGRPMSGTATAGGGGVSINVTVQTLMGWSPDATQQLAEGLRTAVRTIAGSNVNRLFGVPA
jgi:hypothetical protein